MSEEWQELLDLSSGASQLRPVQQSDLISTAVLAAGVIGLVQPYHKRNGSVIDA